jgi:Fe2+ or Zn2+ uptake regulation protein
VDRLVQDARGFEILDVRLEFLGICPHCREPGEDVPRKTDEC